MNHKKKKQEKKTGEIIGSPLKGFLGALKIIEKQRNNNSNNRSGLHCGHLG